MFTLTANRLVSLILRKRVKFGAEGGNRTPMVLLPHDFESCASASSATSAKSSFIIT